MKYSIRIVLFLVFGVIATGCNKPTDKDSKAQSDDSGTVAAQREKAVTATKEASHLVQDYVYAQKDEFIDAAKRELAEMQADMERLGAAMERSTGAARADAEAKLKVVSDKWAAAKAQLDQAEAATEATWQDVQNRYRTAQTDLQNSFDATRAWLSERIEP